jgi:twitching motility two-component system response regulator PilH
MTIKKILVVDDSPADLENIRNIVKSAGYQVSIADSGKTAVSKALAEIPDIIFLDIVMDDLDGYGACREILENKETSEVPIIFVSTKNTRVDQMWAKRQGARGLIPKPYKSSDILDEIEKY